MEGLTVCISQLQMLSFTVSALFCPVGLWLLLSDLLCVHAHTRAKGQLWHTCSWGHRFKSCVLSVEATPWCCPKRRWLFCLTSGFQAISPYLSGLILVWEELDSMVLAGPSQLGISCDSMMWPCFVVASGAAHCLSFSLSAVVCFAGIEVSHPQ